MTTPTYLAEIEYSDGIFTNVTSALQGAYISRAIADTLTSISGGRAVVSFDNDDGKFNDSYRENVFPFSQTFSGWTQTYSAEMLNYTYLAPDGTYTAAIISDTNSQEYSVLQYFTNSGTMITSMGQQVTGSIFVYKKPTPASSFYPSMILGFSDGLTARAGIILSLDLLTGSATASVFNGPAIVDSYGVVNYSAQYWRAWVTGHMTVDSAVNACYMNIYPAMGQGSLGDSNASAVGSVAAWGMQVNRGPLKIYTPTSGAVVTPFIPIGKKLRIKATDSGSTRSLFTGYIQTIDYDAMIGNRSATFNCYDIVQKISRANIDSDMYTDTQVDSLAYAVCSLAGVGSLAAIDTIADKVTYFWANNEAASLSLKRLVDYGHHYLYGSADGDIHFRHRNSYGSATPVGSYNEFFGFTSTFDEERLINDVNITGNARKLSTTQATLAWIVTPVLVDANSTETFWLSYIDPAAPTETAPAKNMVTPTKSADWVLFVNSDGTGTNMTSTSSTAVTFFGESAKCTIYNNASSAAYLTKYQLQGYSIQAAPSIRQTVVDSASFNLYGAKRFTMSSDLIYSSAYAKHYGQFLLDNYKNALPAINTGLKNIFPDVLDIDIGKTISISNSFSLVNSTYLVKALTHTIDVSQRGVEHEVQMVLQNTNVASF